MLFTVRDTATSLLMWVWHHWHVLSIHFCLQYTEQSLQDGIHLKINECFLGKSESDRLDQLHSIDSLIQYWDRSITAAIYWQKASISSANVSCCFSDKHTGLVLFYQIYFYRSTFIPFSIWKFSKGGKWCWTDVFGYANFSPRMSASATYYQQTRMQNCKTIFTKHVQIIQANRYWHTVY